MSAQNETGTPPRRRSPFVAAVFSGLFPGLGQLYNRQRLKALGFLLGAAVTTVGPFSPLDVDIDLDNPAAGMRTVLLATLPFLFIALWSVIDAYRTARNRSRSAEVPSAVNG